MITVAESKLHWNYFLALECFTAVPRVELIYEPKVVTHLADERSCRYKGEC